VRQGADPACGAEAAIEPYFQRIARRVCHGERSVPEGDDGVVDSAHWLVARGRRVVILNRRRT